MTLTRDNPLPHLLESGKSSLPMFACLANNCYEVPVEHDVGDLKILYNGKPGIESGTIDLRNGDGLKVKCDSKEFKLTKSEKLNNIDRIKFLPHVRHLDRPDLGTNLEPKMETSPPRIIPDSMTEVRYLGETQTAMVMVTSDPYGDNHSFKRNFSGKNIKVYVKDKSPPGAEWKELTPPVGRAKEGEQRSQPANSYFLHSLVDPYKPDLPEWSLSYALTGEKQGANSYFKRDGQKERIVPVYVPDGKKNLPNEVAEFFKAKGIKLKKNAQEDLSYHDPCILLNSKIHGTGQTGQSIR